MEVMEFHAAVESLLRQTSEKIILPRYRSLRDDEIIVKGDDDVVTVADREAEDMLSEGLSKLADIPIVGEEAAYADPSVMERLSGDCWIIDPIDGTKNFASGEGHFGILLAMASGGEAHTGWIYDPRRERLLIAHRGKGAFCNGERVTARESGRSPPTLAAMTAYMAPDQRELFETEILPHYEQVLAPACAAEQYPLAAFGQHDLAIYERTLPWDHAAGCLFLNEAGGRSARQDGSPYRVDSDRKGMIAASSERLWERFVELLDRSGYRPGG